MEKKRVLICIPSLGIMDAKFVQSMLALDTEWYDITYKFTIRMLIDRARNKLFQEALLGEYDYMFFIDDDTIFRDTDTLNKMVQLDKPIVTGLYFNRSSTLHEPVVSLYAGDSVTGQPLAGKDDDWFENGMPKEPFKVDYTGGGCLLIRKDAIDKVAELTTTPFDEMRTMFGEDYSFCERCRQLGIEIWCDPTFELGHLSSCEIDEKDWIR